MPAEQMTQWTPEALDAAKQWLTQDEAAAILGCSVRSIQRKAEAGQIHTSTARRRGKRVATLYDASDVEHIRAEMAMSARGPAELATVPRQQPEDSPAVLALEKLATIGERLRNAAMPRRWLTPEQASADSGLTPRLLRRLAIDGKILAVKDGHTWKIASDALATWEPESSRTK